MLSKPLRTEWSHTAIVARGRNAMVTTAMALMDLLSFFKT